MAWEKGLLWQCSVVPILRTFLSVHISCWAWACMIFRFESVINFKALFFSACMFVIGTANSCLYKSTHYELCVLHRWHSSEDFKWSGTMNHLSFDWNFMAWHDSRQLSNASISSKYLMWVVATMLKRNDKQSCWLLNFSFPFFFLLTTLKWKQIVWS